MAADAHTMERARHVALARELIAQVRANGHDVAIDGSVSFRLGVSKPAVEPAPVRGKELPSYALSVDLFPYEELFERPDRDVIFVEALGEMGQ